MNKTDEIRKAAEDDLLYFAQLVNPLRMYGDIHEEVFHWLSSEDPTVNQLLLLARAVAHLRGEPSPTRWRPCWPANRISTHSRRGLHRRSSGSCGVASRKNRRNVSETSPRDSCNSKTAWAHRPKNPPPRFCNRRRSAFGSDRSQLRSCCWSALR